MKNDENFKKRFLVVLADRQRGRYFTIHLGSFEDQGEEILDRDVPQNVKAEHTRPGKVQNHIRDHLYKHLKHVGVEALNYLIKKRIKGIEGVIIGGHQELLSRIKEFLPSKLKNKVVGQFIAKPNLPLGDLTEKANKILKV